MEADERRRPWPRSTPPPSLAPHVAVGDDNTAVFSVCLSHTHAHTLCPKLCERADFMPNSSGA